IDDDEGASCLVDADTLRWENPFQAIVDRTIECPSVQHRLECEPENVWHITGHVFEVVVTAPTQHVEHQHVALECVDQIFANTVPAHRQSPTTLHDPNGCTSRHQAVESTGERQQPPCQRPSTCRASPTPMRFAGWPRRPCRLPTRQQSGVNVSGLRSRPTAPSPT